MRRGVWAGVAVTGVAGAAGLAAWTWFLAGRSLDVMDQWSSVVSSLATLASLVLAAMALIMSASGPVAARPSRAVSEPHGAAEVLSKRLREHWSNNQESLPRPGSLTLTTRWRTVGPPVSDHWSNVRLSSSEEPIDLDSELSDLHQVIEENLPLRRLAVIGLPGSGKSTLLLWLVSDWYRSNAADRRVPVLLQLVDWDPEAETLAEFVRSQVSSRYRVDVSPDESGALLESALLLLDGLDEMPASRRELAVQQLNAESFVDLQFVLTCRMDEYRRIASWSVVRNTAVVEVEPIAATEALQFLRRLTPPQRVGSWDAVAAHVEAHPDGALATALSTPLIINVVKEVYALRRNSPSELLTSLQSGDITGPLIARYVPALYRTENRNHRAWRRLRHGPSAAARYYAFLATLIYELRTVEFAWWDIAKAAPAALLRLPVAVLAGAVAYGVGDFYAGPLVAGLAALIAAVGIGFLEPYDYQPKRFRLSVRARSRSQLSARRGLPIAAVVTIVLVNNWRHYGWSVAGLPLAAVVVSGAIVVFFLQLSLSSEARVIDTSLTTTHSLRAESMRSLGRTLIPFVVAGVLWLMGPWGPWPELLTPSPVPHPAFIAPGTLFILAAVAAVAVAFSTAVGGHLLSRLHLFVTGRAPIRWVAFLDDAVAKGLLRRNGSRYQMHTVFRDALAGTGDGTRAEHGTTHRPTDRDTAEARELPAQLERTPPLFQTVVRTLATSPDGAMPVPVVRRTVRDQLDAGSRWSFTWRWYWSVTRPVRRGSRFVRGIHGRENTDSLALKVVETAWILDSETQLGDLGTAVWRSVELLYGRRRRRQSRALGYAIAFVEVALQTAPPWERTPDFVRSYGCRFAELAGRLDDVLADLDFLVEANPQMLRPYLDRATDRPAQRAVQVYREALRNSPTADPPARRRLIDSYCELQAPDCSVGRHYWKPWLKWAWSGSRIDPDQVDCERVLVSHFSAHSREVIVQFSGGQFGRVDVATGEQYHALGGESFSGLSLLQWVDGASGGALVAVGAQPDHDDTVCEVLQFSPFSPDGRLVESQRLGFCALARDHATAFALNGEYLLAYAPAGARQVSIRNMTAGAIVAKIDVDEDVVSLTALTCDGRPTLAVGANSFVQLFDLNRVVTTGRRSSGRSSPEFTLRFEEALSGQRRMWAAAASGAGSGTASRAPAYCVTADAANQLYCWDTLNGGLVGNPLAHNEPVVAVTVAVAIRQPTVIVGDARGAVLRWTPLAGRFAPVHHFPGPASFLTARESKVGSYVLVGSDGNLYCVYSRQQL